MPRIPNELIESIKRDVPCRQVLEASGSVFAKHGADIVCVCPFHADKTPSLIISERKNLWRCHGACGIGGDVVALTMKLKGVSFRHAVELLAEGLPTAGKQTGSFSFAAAAPVARSTVRALPCPLDASADDTRLMSQVVDYYAARLAAPGNAGRAYLASRGLDDADFVRRFALGFADRSLGLRLPTKRGMVRQRARWWGCMGARCATICAPARRAIPTCRGHIGACGIAARICATATAR